MQTCAVATRLNIVSVSRNARCALPSSGLAALPRPNARRILAPIPALPGTANVSVPGDKADLPGYLATAGLLASQLTSRVSFSPELLYTSLAVYQLIHVVLSVVDGKTTDDKIAGVVAPTFLASAALGFFNGHFTALQTATAAFGYFLAQGLPGPLPLWLASLGYAIYSNHPAEWAVAAFGLSAAYKVFLAAKEKEVPAPQQVLFLAVAAWAFWANAAQQVAVLIFGGHVLASTVS